MRGSPIESVHKCVCLRDVYTGGNRCVHIHVHTCMYMCTTCEQLVHILHVYHRMLLETQVTGDCEICTGLTGAKLHVVHVL